MTNLHVTIREEDLDGTGRRVVVRLGVWDNNHVRDTYSSTVVEAYERLLVENPELRDRLAAKHGDTFYVLSVFVRPGDPGLRPDTEGSAELDAWLGNPPADVRGQYREAVIADLLGAGFDVLPTTTTLTLADGSSHSSGDGHYDIVCEDLSDEVLDRLLAVFSDVIRNPFKTKQRRS